MNAKDQLKIIGAGFIIIRRDYQKLKIKFKSRVYNEWKYYTDIFPSKAALDKHCEKMLKQIYVVED